MSEIHDASRNLTKSTAGVRALMGLKKILEDSTLSTPEGRQVELLLFRAFDGKRETVKNEVNKSILFALASGIQDELGELREEMETLFDKVDLAKKLIQKRNPGK